MACLPKVEVCRCEYKNKWKGWLGVAEAHSRNVMVRWPKKRDSQQVSAVWGTNRFEQMWHLMLHFELFCCPPNSPNYWIEMTFLQRNVNERLKKYNFSMTQNDMAGTLSKTYTLGFEAQNYSHTISGNGMHNKKCITLSVWAWCPGAVRCLSLPLEVALFEFWFSHLLAG